MKVCLIAEGCYPYIVGGVSSWVQMLISEFPEIEFCVYTIGVDENEKGKYKYEIPKNVVEIHETFIDSVYKTNGKLKYFLNKAEKEALESLFVGEEVNWDGVFDMLRNKYLQVNEFLMGRDFFDLAVNLYEARYSRTVFIDFLWTLRSMYLPTFSVLKNDIPEADLYHAVSAGYAGLVGSMAKHLYKKPFLMTEHGIYTREREEEIIKAEWTKGYFKDMWIRHFYKLSYGAYSYADKVVTLFETNRELQIELGCSPDKSIIIPNGVRVEDYEDLPQKDQNEKALNIGAIVRIAPIKDIKTMLNAFDMVKAEIPEARFYIMGPEDEDKEYYSECHTLLKNLGTRDVVFTGKIDVKQYIGKMDIMVLTSISEGQPIAVLEGMAAGKAWVVTNVGACAEMMEGCKGDKLGNAGLVVPAINALRISEAIVSLCRDENRRMKMGEIGHERVKRYYRSKSFLKKYVNLYKELGDGV